MLYSVLAFPWLLLKLPLAYTFVLHLKPTAYNQAGQVVPRLTVAVTTNALGHPQLTVAITNALGHSRSRHARIGVRTCTTRSIE